VAEPERSFYLLSLGCPKNTVDSDCLVSSLARTGWRNVERPEDAAVLIVNTCSFIVPAVEESLEAVLELSDLRSGGARRVVVTGCLVSRYGAESLIPLLPEVDLFVDLSEYPLFASLMEDLVAGNVSESGKALNRHHASTLTRGYVYIKICEGCMRGCAYCTIPSIRGPLVSRTREDIRDEAQLFVARGAHELVLVAQDTTSYGLDLYAKPSLPMLINNLSDIDGDWRMRVMYMHPEGVDRALIRAMRDTRTCAYLDLPFQHADQGVLQGMGRRGGPASHRDLLELVREGLEDAALRATLMVGFPGEDDKAFATLYDFVADSRFDWLGLFSYSHEEGTPAFSLGKGVPAMVARARLEEIAALQEEIMLEKALGMVGRKVRVLVEGESEEAPGFWEARSWREAPEIDGVIFIPHDEGMKAGDFREASITANEGIDLVGVIEGRWQ
jgi:ribosomal protein S12 methylthiotransferase